MFHSRPATGFFFRTARHLYARLAYVLITCCLCVTPLRTHADTPSGAPAGTHVMLYNLPGAPLDVTAQYHQGGSDGYITPANGQPTIYVTFNYTTGQMFNRNTGNQNGYLAYPL